MPAQTADVRGEGISVVVTYDGDPFRLSATARRAFNALIDAFQDLGRAVGDARIASAFLDDMSGEAPAAPPWGDNPAWGDGLDLEIPLNGSLLGEYELNVRRARRRPFPEAK